MTGQGAGGLGLSGSQLLLVVPIGVLLGVGLLATHPMSTARAWRRLAVVALIAGALAAPLLWIGTRSPLVDETGWALTRATVPIEIVAAEGTDPRHFLLPPHMGGPVYELATAWLPGDFPELEERRRINHVCRWNRDACRLGYVVTMLARHQPAHSQKAGEVKPDSPKAPDITKPEEDSTGEDRPEKEQGLIRLRSVQNGQHHQIDRIRWQIVARQR